MTRPMMRSRALVSALAILAASSCLAAASTLSKAVRTSESVEPALSFPAQEQAAQSKLDAVRTKTGKRPNIVWLLDRRHGLGRSWRVSAAARRSVPPRRTWTGWRARASS